MDHVASTPKGNEVNLDDETRLLLLTGACKTGWNKQIEGCWKDGKRWKEIGKLRFEIWKHCWTYMHTSSQIPDSFIPFSSSPQKHPKTIGTSRPIALLPSFFLHLEALQVEPLEDPPLRHASYSLPRALPNDSNEVEKPPKRGISDSMIIWTVDFNTPETNSIDISHQLLVELNFCVCLPKGLTCYATKEHILKSF